MNSTSFSTFPTDEIIALMYEGSSEITTGIPFLRMPSFYNPKSLGFLNQAIEGTLGESFLVETAHYYSFQSINKFDANDFGSVSIQPAIVKSFTAKKAERKFTEVLRVGSIEENLFFDGNGKFLASKLRGIIRGSAQSLSALIYSYILEKYFASNKLIEACYDSTNKILVPHGAPYATYIAANNNLLADGRFNLLSLNTVFSQIRQVLGESTINAEYPYVSVIKRSLFNSLLIGQSLTFTNEIVMEGYRNSLKDVVKMMGGEVYSLSTRDVNGNDWIYSNPNNAIPLVNSATGVPVTAPVFTLQTFTTDGTNMTAVIKNDLSTSTSVLGVGATFGFEDQSIQYTLAGDTATTEGRPLTLVLDKPDGYLPGNKATWLYTATGAAPNAIFTVKLVGSIRPRVSVNGVLQGVGNDPNCNITVDFTDITLATPTAINAKLKAFLETKRLVPVIGKYEYVLYYQTESSYQLCYHNIPAPQTFGSTPMGSNLTSNFLEAMNLSLDKNVMRGTEAPVGYQVYPDPAYTQSLLRMMATHTAVFDNYTLRTAAIAFYKN
jgi:hypothetical protein